MLQIVANPDSIPTRVQFTPITPEALLVPPPPDPPEEPVLVATAVAMKLLHCEIVALGAKLEDSVFILP